MENVASSEKVCTEEKPEQCDEQLHELIEIIHFTEKVSVKVHGLLDEVEVYKAVKEEFVKSKRYNASIFLLTDDGSKLRFAQTSLSSEKVKLGEKVLGLRSYKNYMFDLSKSSYLSKVAKEGKTIEVNFIEIVSELFPRPLAYLITKTIGYEKRAGILTPLKRHGKVIGVLVVDSTSLSKHFVPSVKNLAHHISAALELANEYAERKKIEEDLKRSEARLKNIFAASPDAITVSDLNGNIIECNQSTLDMHGYSSKEELTGKSALKLITKKDHQRAMENLKRTLEQGSVRSMEYTFLTKDCCEFPAELSASVIKDSSGEPMGFVAITKDITERKKAERESRIKDAALASSISAVVFTDLEGNLTYVNNSFLKIWGYANDREVLGRPAAEFWLSEENAVERVRMLKALKDGEGWVWELTAKKKDGSTFEAQLSANLVKDETGKPLCMMGSFLDITERRKAGQSLKESEEKYRDLVEREKDIIYSLDDKGKITFANPAVETILGYRPEETIGKNVMVLIPKELQEKTAADFNNLLKTGEITTETVLLDKKGHPHSVEYSSTVIKDGNKVVGTRGIVRDVTERKQMEEKLRQYSEHLEELVQKRTEELSESEKRYSVLVEEASDGVVIFQDEKIAFTNKKGAELIGYSKDELLGVPFEKLVSDID